MFTDRRHRPDSVPPPSHLDAPIPARRRGAARLLAAALLLAAASPRRPLTAAAGGGTATPATAAPAPTECRVPPRSYATMRRLHDAQFAPGGTPVPRPTPGIVPAGTPITPATTAAITATVREFLACFNAGQPLRADSVYTDRYLASLLYGERGFGPAWYGIQATPEPGPPAGWARLDAVSGARVLPDGRVAAIVIITYPNIDKTKRFIFVFAFVGGRWRIDDIVGEISFSVP